MSGEGARYAPLGWLRRGRWQVVLIGFSALLLVVASSGGCLEESNGESSEGRPVYSHDGTWVAFTSGRSGEDEIYVARRGAAATQITESEHGVWSRVFDWSPDGSRIVFARAADEAWLSGGLFVVNRDGGGLRRITKGEDYWPCWAADGETIVFRRGDDIRAVKADGAGGRRLVRNADEPACSPTEPAIAFVVKGRSAVWGGIDIGVLDLRDGSRRVLLGPDASGYEYESPSWSPDGKRIASHVVRPLLASDPEFEHRSMFGDHYWYLTEVYVVGADGSGLERLTKNSVGDEDPTWLPDGRIVFESNRAGPNDFTNSDAFQYYVMESDGTRVELFPWDPTYS